MLRLTDEVDGLNEYSDRHKLCAFTMFFNILFLKYRLWSGFDFYLRPCSRQLSQQSQQFIFKSSSGMEGRYGSFLLSVGLTIGFNHRPGHKVYHRDGTMTLASFLRQ